MIQSKKVSLTPRWSGPVPTRKDGTPLPQNQWARAGRKRVWLVRWFDLDGKRPGKTFHSREEAEAFALGKTIEFEEGGPAARARIQRRTLGQFGDEFEQFRMGPRGQRLSIGTLREYLRILREFAAFVGRDTQLENITAPDVARYVAHLRSKTSRLGKPLSPHSINKAKRSLRTAFNVAIDQFGYLRHNPCEKQKQDRVADTANRYVTPREFAAILGACRKQCESGKRLWWETFVSLCYTSGARANEAVHMTWADVDFDGSAVRIMAKPDSDCTLAWRPKDVESRVVPIPESTIGLLARLQAEATEGSIYVFIPAERVQWIKRLERAGEWREGRAVINNLDRDLKRIVATADVSDVSLHDLRRACITHWARRLPIHVVQDLAGHASMMTTRRFYLSVQESDREQARQAIAEVMLPTEG